MYGSVCRNFFFFESPLPLPIMVGIPHDRVHSSDCLFQSEEMSVLLLYTPTDTQLQRIAQAACAPHLGLDTGTGSTRGFGPRVFPGTGTGWHFPTRAISAYPTRKPAGFHGSKL
jgi:hypothetical protein